MDSTSPNHKRALSIPTVGPLFDINRSTPPSTMLSTLPSHKRALSVPTEGPLFDINSSTPPSTMDSTRPSDKRTLSVRTDDNATSATTRVLQTTELLEEILAYVPVKELLLSQRTCKTFHQTIHGSLRLQRKLYLAPSGKEGDALSINPFLSPFLSTGWGNNGDNRPYKNRYHIKFDGQYYVMGNVELPQFDSAAVRCIFLALQPAEEAPTGYFDMTGSSLSSMYLCQPPNDVSVSHFTEPWRSSYGNSLRSSIPTFEMRGTVADILREVGRFKNQYTWKNGVYDDWSVLDCSEYARAG